MKTTRIVLTCIYVCVYEFPFVGKHLSYIEVYKGFDYDVSRIYDVKQVLELYLSVELAKKDPKWVGIKRLSLKLPEQFNVYPLKICSRDLFGEDWYYGDVMEGMISVTTRRLRVRR